MSRYFGAMTRMCFGPHGMIIVIQRTRLCFLQNGMTLVLRKTRICSVPHSITILVREKPKLLKKTALEHVKRYRRYLHPLYNLKENQGISISLSNLFQFPSITFTFVYIITKNSSNLARNIKESIYIRVNNPSLNNNIGKFNLSHIWDRVLLNTKGLTLK